MGYKKIKNSLLIFLIILQVVLYPLSTFAVNAPFDPSESDTGDEYPDLPENLPDTSEFQRSVNASEEVDDSTDTDEGLSSGFEDVPAADLNELKASTSPSSFVTSNERIILNSIDRRKIQQLVVAGSVMPDLETDLQELSLLSGRSVDDLAGLQRDKLGEFMAVVDTNKSKIKNNEYVKKRLMADPAVLAEYLDMEQGDVIDRLESEKDLVEIEVTNSLNNAIDRRVLKTLVYLVTPKNQGGAGHYKIKVERITKNYDTERKSGEREDQAIREKDNQPTNSNKTIETIKADETSVDQMYDPADNVATQMVAKSAAIVDVINAEGESTASVLIGNDELEPETVSAHFTGQAVDISEIDDIKCTLIEKKRLGGSKKTAKPPQAIKLLYQTQAGYNSEKDKIDASYNEMFLSASQSSLERMFAALNLDATDLGNQEINNFSDISEAIGKSVFGTAIDSPLKDMWNYNLADLLEKTGGAILADKLGLPREPFLDSNLETTEELVEALGRSYIERNINVPYGALRGENSNEILQNIGLARIAQELRLSDGTFDLGISDAKTLNNRIGSRIIEYEFGFPVASFFGKDDLSAVASATGKNRLDSFFRDTNYSDNKLGLKDGTTAKLRDGGLDIKGFVEQVAAARLLRTAYAYPNYAGGTSGDGNSCRNVPTGERNSLGIALYKSVCSSNQTTVTSSNGTAMANWRDEMMNLPEGTIDSFLSFGNVADVKEKLAEAGRFTLAKTLEKNDTGIKRLSNWLKSPNPLFSVTDTIKDEAGQDVSADLCLPVSSYASKLRLSTDDIYNVFANGETSKGIFKRIGKSLFSYAMKPNGEQLKLEKEVSNSLPSYKLPTKEDDFYLDRAKLISDKTAGVKDKFNNILSSLTSDDAGIQGEIESMKNTIGSYSNDLEAAVTTQKSKTNGKDILKENQAVLNKYYLLSGKMTSLSSLINRISPSLSRNLNAAIFQLESLGKPAYEVSTGSEESDFRFEDINIEDINKNVSSAEGDTFVSGNQVALFLSGRVNLKEYLKSLGSSKLSYSLNLPSNALKKASEAINSDAQNSKGMAESLTRSIALSLLEDNAQIDLSKIKAEDLADKVSIDDLVGLFRDKLSLTESKASSIVAKALNLKGLDLNYLKNGDFGAWSQGRAEAEANDSKLNLPKGTTENFVRNKPLGKYDDSIVGKKEIADLSNKLKISEASLKTFIAKKEGAVDPKFNKIYFKSYIKPDATDAENDVAVNQVNGYAYNDKTGEHIFATYEEAEKFRVAHEGDEIDSFSDIAKSLNNDPNIANVLGGENQISEALKGFTNEKKASAFDESKYSSLEKYLFEKLSIDRSLTEKLFKRSGKDDNLGAVDFLKILGNKYVTRNVLPELNDNLDVGLGFAQLDAGDLLKVLNGQGKEVLSTVGSFLVDKEQGVTPGTILKLTQTPPDKSGAKSELKRENAFELFANALGVNGIDFKNSLSLGKVFGKTKIENVFGLAKGTFTGNNLNQIIENSSPINLAKSFKIPVGDDTRALSNQILKDIMGDSSAYANKSFYDQLGLIEVFKKSSGLDKLSNDVRTKISNLESSLKKMSLEVLSSASILQGEQAPAFATLKDKIKGAGGEVSSNALLSTMLESLQGQFSAAAGSLGVTVDGIVGSLIGEAGLTIDSLIHDVSEKVLANPGNNVGINLATILGLSENQSFGSAQLGQMVDRLRSSLENDIYDILDLGDLGAQLDGLFTSNFDDKAGFAYNTFNSIFEGLGKTAGILIEQGLKILDGQLGTLQNGNNMANFANIAISAIGSDWSNVIASGSDISNALNGISVDGDHDTFDIENIGTQIAGIAKNTVTDAQKLWHSVTKTDMFGREYQVLENGFDGLADIARGEVSGYLQNKFDDIFKGDFRPLQMLGMINGLAQILGKECAIPGDKTGTCLSVPENFSFNFENIFGSVFGESFANPGALDAVAAQANDWMVAMTNQGSTTEATATAISNGDNPIQTPVTSTNSTATPEPGSPEYAAINYPVPAGFETELPPMPSMDDAAAYAQWEFMQGKAVLAESSARATFQDSLGKAFQFKMMDCNIFKDKGFIPKGFSKAMFEGSPFDKINTLTQMFGGFFGGEGFEKLTEIFGAIEKAQSIVLFFNSDGPKDINSLAAVLEINLDDLVSKLDTIILEKAPTIMGINLGQGIAGSLLAFAQSRDLTKSFEGVIKSFKDNFGSVDGAVGLVTNWADEKLGLPSGTAMEMYENLRGISTSTFSFAGANFSGPWAIVASIVAAKIQEFIQEMAVKLIGVVTTAVENALGLVPGSLTQLVMSCLMFGPTPMALAAFIITNLIGVYKVLLVCTIDGYYPAKENPPNPEIWDSPGFGTYDGMSADARESNTIKAAQYKADRLIKDVLEMADATGDENQIPTQIMTGRKEDVAANAPSVAATICAKVGSGTLMPGTAICSGWYSRAGLWANPQTTAWTHIGF